MSVTVRAYDFSTDFDKVSRFLVAHYQPGNKDGNWLQPAWEYMHYHPALDKSALPQIGIWEDSGELVAVAHYEWALGEAFFQVHPQHTRLKPDMLAYAEANLGGETESGQRFLNAYVNDFDGEFEAITLERGFHQQQSNKRPMTSFTIPRPFPAITLPDGFHLKSLADDNDLTKIHRVLWRGFNHPGEPSPEDIGDRVIMQSGPNFRHDLTIVVVAPDGNFASFCGMWYEPVNRYAYVEPVATDPDYRRLGLGKAAVLEGIRRCSALGATVAYVGSDLPFYLALGFERVFDANCWYKSF